MSNLMEDFTHLLSQKVDTISQQWVEAVAQNRQIPSTNRLSKSAIEDHIPHVLKALVSVLATTEPSDIKTIISASLQHGFERAEQGFDPTEIVREYNLLRTLIIANLQTDLLQATAQEVLRAVTLINNVVDEAVAQCFKSYLDARLQELNQLQSQLTLTVEQLQRLICANQENLSVLAHELKTPLNSIISYSELFLHQQRTSVVQETTPSLEHIERVLRNGRQLLQLINDLLELSRCEAGKMQLHPATINVRSIINTVRETMQPLAQARALELILECDQAPTQVLTDPLRLQQILTNLVSNAIRYTETGYVIIKCYSEANNQWVLIVNDTGIGIAPEDRERIFEPFTRTQHLHKHHLPDSAGLGLAIVARLVKLLQAEISLTSQLAVGSTFVVRLPLEIKI
jgi:signal transduction histidine kinase